jgi:hypothetical protein
MANSLEVPHGGKSIGDLWVEAAWFAIHTALAICALFIAIGLFSLTGPSMDDSTPKIIGTVLAFFAPLFAGAIIAWRQQNDVACYVWISGLLIFAIVCVWVLDLPTGPGLCEHCLATEKLTRTLFDFSHGSGLLAGQGLMVGTWIPLSLFGYAIGARFGIK